MNCRLFTLTLVSLHIARSNCILLSCCEGNNDLDNIEEILPAYNASSTWPVQRKTSITDFDILIQEGRGKHKVKKKLKRFLLPLLLAYKLKFFTLVPVLIGGLVLLTGATGLAGFFFALFAAVIGLKSGHGHHRMF